MRTTVKSTKIKIIAVREDIRIISAGKTGSTGWCHSCAAITAMVTPDSAALLCMQTTRAIYQQVEAGHLHYTEGPEGLKICVASLRPAPPQPGCPSGDPGPAGNTPSG